MPASTFTKRHFSSWRRDEHYGNCGQSCLCCRSIIEGIDGFNTCDICNQYWKTKNQLTHESNN